MKISCIASGILLSGLTMCSRDMEEAGNIVSSLMLTFEGDLFPPSYPSYRDIACLLRLGSQT